MRNYLLVFLMWVVTLICVWGFAPSQDVQSDDSTPSMPDGMYGKFLDVYVPVNQLNSTI